MRIQNNQLRHTLNYGAIIGGTITLYEFMLYIFGMTNNKALENVTLFLFVLGVYITIKRFRDIESGGVISFKRAFSTGFLTCLFIGIIGTLYTYIQMKYLSPHLLDEIMEMSQERLLSRGISDNQVELQTSIMEKMITPGFIALTSLFSSVFWGTIASLILAVLLKREENPLLK
ncbi:MAG: DUF4199 domain-containing protein [Bacteroidales bacterium]|nr:DUF4199 domain-containing protein [Bacteroidales bacterium]